MDNEGSWEIDGEDENECNDLYRFGMAGVYRVERNGLSNDLHTSPHAEKLRK